ncbi:hypothetical protein CLU79DRAFT_745987 [Phycomyces nitens]|nr:hypothetical protein CLU79DRAFT_745987 [Phycomyces nitens]
MADYWVSQQRHWCKYCKKFIANNKPSIQIHETGLAHKNQVENFLRDVYKRGREEKKQNESVRRELQRIEKAALLSYNGKDTGKAPVQSSPAPTVRSGIEAYGIGEYGSGLYGSDAFGRSGGKMPLPEQPVVKEPKPAPPPTSPDKSGATSKKEEPQIEDEDEEDEEDLRNFKIKEKEYPVTITSLDEVEEEMVFKKRKAPSSTPKKRNIRRKTDTQDD